MAESHKQTPGNRPAILVSANSTWNIVNFRMALLDALADEGYRLTVAAPADSYAAQIVHRGYEYYDLPMNRSGTNPFGEGLLFLRYLRLIRRIRPAAFLGFTIKPNIYGSLAARLTGTAAIPNVSGLGTAFIDHAWLERLAILLYRVALRDADVVFFQNFDDQRLFIEKQIVRSNRARRIPGSGVDLERFRPVASKNERSISFLFVGRLLRDKGVREFVEAARRVRLSFPQARFQLLGESDFGNRTAIREDEIRAWTEEGLVEYLGSCADVRPFIADATAVVLPSYREGLPRTLLEGAAMAKALIASDVPGCREVVIDGVTGVLCDARDPVSLAEALMKVAQMDERARQRLGAGARAHVAAKFDQARVTTAYLEALAEVVLPS